MRLVFVVAAWAMTKDDLDDIAAAGPDAQVIAVRRFGAAAPLLGGATEARLRSLKKSLTRRRDVKSAPSGTTNANSAWIQLPERPPPESQAPDPQISTDRLSRQLAKTASRHGLPDLIVALDGGGARAAWKFTHTQPSVPAVYGRRAGIAVLEGRTPIRLLSGEQVDSTSNRARAPLSLAIANRDQLALAWATELDGAGHCGTSLDPADIATATHVLCDLEDSRITRLTADGTRVGVVLYRDSRDSLAHSANVAILSDPRVSVFAAHPAIVAEAERLLNREVPLIPIAISPGWRTVASHPRATGSTRVVTVADLPSHLSTELQQIPDVAVRSLSRLPTGLAIAELRRADIVVCDLSDGSTGVWELAALAAGRITIASPTTLSPLATGRAHGDPAAWRLPIVPATRATLLAVVAATLEERESAVNRATKGPAFVGHHWPVDNPDPVLAKFMAGR